MIRLQIIVLSFIRQNFRYRDDDLLIQKRRINQSKPKSDFDDLRSSDDRIGLGDLLPAGGLVVEGAIMGVGVAMLPTK